jgi:hypothetical protein
LELISCVDILIDGKWQGKPVSDPNSNQKIWVKKNNTFELIAFEELKKKKY